MKTFQLSQITIFFLTIKKNIKLSVFWGIILAVITATNAIGTLKAGINLSYFASTIAQNTGLTALFGKGYALGTLEGYVTWKVLGISAIIMAIWGFITAAGLFRGDEEEGRFEIIAAGKTTLRRMTENVFLGMYVCIAVIYILLSSLLLIFCNSNGVHFAYEGILLLSFAMIASSLILVPLTGFISQLFPTKQRVLTFVIGIYAVMYIGRMLADTSSNVAFLNNIDPLGWIENIQPFTSNNIIWIVPIGVFAFFFTLLAIYLSGKRDITTGLIHEHLAIKSRMTLLHNAYEFMFRQSLGQMLGWSVGIGVFFSIAGSIANAGVQALNSSQKVSQALSKVTPANGNIIGLFLGFMFFFAMILLSFIAINRIDKLRKDESMGYLDNLFVRKEGRIPWIAFFAGMSLLEMIFVACVAGIAAWLGASSVQHSIVFASFMKASINAISPGVFLFGLGMLIYGFFPRVATSVQYLVLGWSVIVDLIGPSINLNSHILDTSVFYHLPLVPAVNPDWHAISVLFILGIVGCVIGGIAFNQRDLQSD